MLWDVDVSPGNGMYKSVLGPVGHIHVQSQLWWADVVDRRKVYWTVLKAGGKLDQDTIADLNYVYRVSNPLAALHPVPRSLTPGFDSRPWTICSSYKLEKPHTPFLAVVWGLQTWRSTECHCTHWFTWWREWEGSVSYGTEVSLRNISGNLVRLWILFKSDKQWLISGLMWLN